MAMVVVGVNICFVVIYMCGAFCLFVLLSHVSNVQEEDTVFLCGKLLTEMNTVTRKWRLNMNSLTSDQRTVIFVLKYVLN